MCFKGRYQCALSGMSGAHTSSYAARRLLYKWRYQWYRLPVPPNHSNQCNRMRFYFGLNLRSPMQDVFLKTPCTCTEWVTLNASGTAAKALLRSSRKAFATSQETVYGNSMVTIICSNIQDREAACSFYFWYASTFTDVHLLGHSTYTRYLLTISLLTYVYLHIWSCYYFLFGLHYSGSYSVRSIKSCSASVLCVQLGNDVRNIDCVALPRCGLNSWL
jgi:hypothetical protein